MADGQIADYVVGTEIGNAVENAADNAVENVIGKDFRYPLFKC